LSYSIIFKPKMITNIVGQFNEHLSTNLQIWEVLKLWDKFKDVKKENISNHVLDNGPNGLLVDSIAEDSAYILTPRSGDFSEIQYFVNTIFSEGPKDINTIVKEERTKLEVRNGTWINGLASKVALDLEKLGFTIVRIGNNSNQRFEKSVIYDLTFGEKNKSLEILKNRTNANIAYGLPDWLEKEISGELKNEPSPIKPDFILILGQDADKNQSGAVNTENSQ
jgi:hypothetical protein